MTKQPCARRASFPLKLLQQIGLVFVAGIAILFSGVLLDRGLSPHAGLIYPPETTVTYRTNEFEFVAHVNDQGFRGRTIAPGPSPCRFRVLTLGDSFTYGWGVGDEEVWSAILNDRLASRGSAVEIANMGWVGQGPAEYVDLAKRALPRFEPDLVIVGVLQGDDLQQVRSQEFQVGRTIRKVFPNIARILQRVRQGDIADQRLGDVWRRQAQMFLEDMSGEELHRFQALDTEIQYLFLEGLLNPHQIALGVRRPRYYLEGIDWYATQPRIEELARQLKRLDQLASEHQAQVLVLSMPHGNYVNERYLRGFDRQGFESVPEMPDSNVPDEAITKAATLANLPVVSVLDRFRGSNETLFFALDGHLTTAGNRLLAEELVSVLESQWNLTTEGNAEGSMPR